MTFFVYIVYNKYITDIGGVVLKVIGLCGGSGSGKGTVAKLFLDYGVPSIDTDAVYHGLTSKKTPCTEALADEFGNEIINPDGSLNRKSLAKIVFSGDGSSVKREALNRISHKFVLDKTREMLREHEAKGVNAAIVDAPLLFESGFNEECDLIISVIAKKDIRVSRIVNRDGISEADALSRIEAQKSDEYLTAHSDYVIENSKGLDDVRRAVGEIIEKILK